MRKFQLKIFYTLRAVFCLVRHFAFIEKETGRGRDKERAAERPLSHIYGRSWPRMAINIRNGFLRDDICMYLVFATVSGAVQHSPSVQVEESMTSCRAAGKGVEAGDGGNPGATANRRLLA